MRTRLCLILGAAVLAGLGTSSALRADPPGQATMADAARNQKTCFVLFWKEDDAATRAVRQTLNTFVEARDKQAAWVSVRTTDAAEKAVVDRFGVSRAPMPLVLAVAPNGAITGGFPQKVTEAQLSGAFVSPNMAKCLHALQSRKLVLLCVQPPKEAVPAGVTQFQADPQYLPHTAVVSLDPADPAEARHLKDLQVTAGTAYVPKEVVFQEKWRLALDLLQRVRQELPGQWVAGDDEFGRCTELREQLRVWDLRYVLDVPCDTLVREVGERRPPSRLGGRERLPLFERVEHWAARQPKGRWRRVTVRDGEKGPIKVEVLLATVQTKDADGRVGPQERVAVLRPPGSKKEVWYTLSNDRKASRGELARVHGDRHVVEELLQQGKQEVGLSHYEVRSWTGWHHHITLTLLALWFLQLEKLRLKKNASDDGGAGACRVYGVIAEPGGESGRDRGGNHADAATQRAIPRVPLASHHRRIPTPQTKTGAASQTPETRMNKPHSRITDDEFRRIRDLIEAKVKDLLAGVGVEG